MELGVWIIANACAAHQIVSRALFHQLAEDLAVTRSKRGNPRVPASGFKADLAPRPRKKKRKK